MFNLDFINVTITKSYVCLKCESTRVLYHYKTMENRILIGIMFVCFSPATIWASAPIQHQCHYWQEWKNITWCETFTLLMKLNQTTRFIGQHGSEQEAMSQWTSFCKVNRKTSVVPKLSLEREDELTIPERGLLNLPSGINKVGLSTFPSKWVQNTGKAEESIWHVCFWKRYYE